MSLCRRRDETVVAASAAAAETLHAVVECVCCRGARRGAAGCVVVGKHGPSADIIHRDILQCAKDVHTEVTLLFGTTVPHTVEQDAG